MACRSIDSLLATPLKYPSEEMKTYDEVLRTRQIVLFQRISVDVAEDMISSIRALSLNGVTEAELLINSCGGSTASVLNLYDAILASGINFRGIVVAECLNTAVTVLQACKTRHAFPHASFVVSETSREFKVKIKRSKALDFYLQNAEEVYASVIGMDARNERALCSRLKSNRVLFDKHYQNGSHFYPEDALEMGLIDEIIAPDNQPTKGDA
jgi:ATP-dependent protease ClpP protease subunit